MSAYDAFAAVYDDWASHSGTSRPRLPFDEESQEFVWVTRRPA